MFGAQAGGRPQDFERVSRTVHVGGIGGLGETISEQDVADFFGQQGEVTAVRISGRFCWVEFADVRAAHAALELDGTVTGGHHLRVSQSKSAIHSNGLKKRVDGMPGMDGSMGPGGAVGYGGYGGAPAMPHAVPGAYGMPGAAGHYGYPQATPQQAYGYPPPQGYGAPPTQAAYPQYPPQYAQQAYGAPYGYAQPQAQYSPYPQAPQAYGHAPPPPPGGPPLNHPR